MWTWYIGGGIEEHPCKNIWESTKNVYTDVSITVLGVKKKQVKNELIPTPGPALTTGDTSKRK